MGPFDTPVPRDFFYQPQIHIKSNGLNYHATFDLEIAGLAETTLIIENAMKDSSPIPVTVSVIFPKGEWRNFIITLPESNIIKINMNSRIMEIFKEKNYDVSHVDLLTFVVISGSPINVKLSDSSLTRGYTWIPIFKPEVPGGGGGTSDPPGGGGGGTTGCDPCTSQGGGMTIHVINNQNGGVDQAYLNVGYTWEESQGVRTHHTWVQVDYPNNGQAFHLATNSVKSTSWIVQNTCISSEWGAHTTQSHNANCAFNLQRHSWYDIKKLTHHCGTATAVATSGCNAGWSWTITF